MIDGLIFLVLIILSGFFSSAETAFFSLHMHRIKMMLDRKVPGAKLVYRLKKHPERLLITILIGNNLVNLFTAGYATLVAQRFFGSAALGIATGVTTLFILIFGEIMPKSLAFTHNEKIARLFARPLYILSLVVWPVAHVLLLLTRAFNKIFKVRRVERVNEEEVRMMARLGAEHGGIDYRERELIENVFQFDDVAADDAMTPLYRVKTLNGTVPVDQIAHLAGVLGFSRYPVYADNETDQFIGYIHVNTILRVLNSDERDKPIAEFVQPLDSVPETRSIERVFRAMKRERVHMYLVHRSRHPDEILGIITLEDIVEELVGEIEDETDELRDQEQNGG
jgi:CBS domain containing-hemolysin-like protein